MPSLQGASCYLLWPGRLGMSLVLLTKGQLDAAQWTNLTSLSNLGHHTMDKSRPKIPDLNLHHHEQEDTQDTTR